MAGETILLLDDDPATVNVLRDVLQERGHFTVLAAGNLEQALGICQQHQGSIMVLVSDVMLRQLGRKEIIAQMRQQRPAMGLLLISGYGVEDLVKRGCLELSDLATGNTFFLQKPFSVQALVTTVRSLIAKLS